MSRAFVVCWFAFLLLPSWSDAQQDSGANSRTLQISEDPQAPAISSITLEIPEGATITRITGNVFIDHVGPSELIVFLVHPLASSNQPPSDIAPWDLGLMSDLMDVGLAAQLINIYQVYAIDLDSPFQDHREFVGDWKLVIFDAVANGVTGILRQWDLNVFFRHDTPPEIIDWVPENASIVSTSGVELSFATYDADDDEIEHFINIYRDNRLIASRPTETLQWNPVRDSLADGIYEIEFLALSGPGDSPRFSARRIIVEVDVNGPQWRSISPPVGKVLSGMEQVQFDATDGGRRIFYTYRFGVGSGLEGAIQQVPGVKATVLFDTRQLRDGYHWLICNAFDWVGNAAERGAMSRVYLVDNSSPVVFFNTVLQNNINLNSNMISLTAADDYSDIRRIKIYLNDALMIDQALTSAGRTKTVVFTLPENLRPDHYTLTVDAEDSAHNIGRGTMAFLYTFQTVEPTESKM